MCDRGDSQEMVLSFQIMAYIQLVIFLGDLGLISKIQQACCVMLLVGKASVLTAIDFGRCKKDTTKCPHNK
jgi:hypothetical protein